MAGPPLGLGLRKMRFGLQSLFFKQFLLGTIASIALFIGAWDHQDRIKDRYKAAYYDTEDEFDFIIVGGGTAGGLLAARLAEEAKWKILVLEAGGEPNPLQCVPRFAMDLLEYKQLNWAHKTVSQDNACLALKNRRAVLHGGKGLGGSSNLGFLMHERGLPSDYDDWATMTEDPSWSYEALLPYFARTEDFREHAGEKGRGVGGPLKIESARGRMASGLAEEWVAAGRELGYEGQNYGEGFDKAYYTSKRGHRGSTFRSFIRRARSLKNVQIFKYSYAYRVLFQGNNQAYGVEYNRHGVKKVAYARKEIILTAGPIHNPKILMLSGIGPEMHLPAIGIPVRSALPVGENLQDHLTTLVGPFFVKDGHSFNADRDVNLNSITQFSNGRGQLTSSGFLGSAILPSGWNYDRPDLHLSLLGSSVSSRTPELFSSVFNMQKEAAQEFFGPAKGKDSFMIAVTASRPESRGKIHLKDNNPKSRVIIDPKYLQDYMDVIVMSEGIRMALQIVENSTSFGSVGAHLYDLPFPGCEMLRFRSEEYWECYIRHFSISSGHLVGTCSMGHPDTFSAVVDQELRVIGVAGLRVADSSVMPTIPSGGTQAPTMMIAERASDIIKDTWLNPDLVLRDELLYWGPNRMGVAESGGNDTNLPLNSTTTPPSSLNPPPSSLKEVDLVKKSNEGVPEVDPYESELNSSNELKPGGVGDEDGAAETLDEVREVAPARYHASAQTRNESSVQISDRKINSASPNRNTGGSRGGRTTRRPRILPANVPLVNFNGSRRSPPKQTSHISSIYDNFETRRSDSDPNIIKPIPGHSLPKLYFHPEN